MWSSYIRISHSDLMISRVEVNLGKVLCSMQCKTYCCVHGTCAWSFDVHRTSRSDSLCTHARTRLRRRSYSKTGLQRRSGKVTPTLCRLVIQVQLSNVNICPLNTLIFAPTAPSRISLFGLPLAKTILPHSLTLPLPNPIYFLPGLFDYPSS